MSHSKFDESKVINLLHPEKVEIGGYYYIASRIMQLRNEVKNGGAYSKIAKIKEDCFITDDGIECELLYPAPVISFDESKVINLLHADKAEVGKTYYYADEITVLKREVESNSNFFDKYKGIHPYAHQFSIGGGKGIYCLLYPAD